MDAPRYCYRHPDRETGLSCSECERPICYECMTPAPVGLRCPEHSGKPQGVQRVIVPAQRAVTGVGSLDGLVFLDFSFDLMLLVPVLNCAHILAP